MKESNEDFLNHIISTLREHKEPYEEGAWERFKALHMAKAKARPVISLWKWCTAAAAAGIAIFLLSKVYHSSNIDIDTNPPINIVTHQAEKITKDTGKTTAIAVSPEVKKYEATENQKSQVGHIAAASLSKAKTGIKNNTDKILTSATPAPVIIPQKELATTPAPKASQQELPGQNNRVDFWKNKIIEDNRQPGEPAIKRGNGILLSTAQPPVKQVPEKEKNKKWQPSLYVSPLFNDQGVDVGYGFSLGYAINDKVKISSGIAHTKLSASHSYDADIPMSGAVSSALSESKKTLKTAYSFTVPQETSTLQHVDGFLSGIDIPVEINYSFSNKLYAAAGISGLIVLDDKKKYTYVDNRNVKVSVETSKGNLKEDKSVTFSDHNTTSAPIETPKENTPFLGFYNFSVGYKQKIFNKNSVSLEPFIKIPMKSVTQQNLKYTGSGIRLKFDF